MHKPPLILIADDEPEFLGILAAKLTGAGFWVAEAKDGSEAVAKAVTLQPDLIVLDVNMPTENGTEAVLDIQNNPATKNARIVFLSSMKAPWPGLKRERKEGAHELGALDFIDKTSDLDDAIAKIRRILEQPVG